MHYAKPLLHAVALASLTLTACSSAPGEVENVGTAQQAALTNNALTNNALTNNALTNNALTNNALTNNALTNNALTNNALTKGALSDPNAREVLTYIVSCALPAGDDLEIEENGVTYSFDGQLGLAPEWGEPDGSCGASCQQWVSACVLSRLDYLGVTREISVRGANPGLSTTTAERLAYPVSEATYYGNIFGSEIKAYACLAPGKTEDPRVCGPSVSSCGVVDVLGPCEDLCGPQRPDGSFPDCWVPLACDGHGFTLPQLYEGSITVFNQP
jgi:hypothetical protein